MKNLVLFFVFAIVVVFILLGCEPVPAPVIKKEPTRLECYQQGVKIIDTETLNGVKIEHVSIGHRSILSWVWQEKDETEKYLTRSETVSCSEYSIVGK
ncbi:MAG TPA: hypothetical protein VLH94_04535 [Spirochaetia bacterium]|nr:hypothetical protein [Spirochaetia bacterium]